MMDRSEFENKLRGMVLPWADAEGKALPLLDVVGAMMPQKLFRYRAFSERSVEAFEKDLIYTVPATWFNDPYDTLIKYDLDNIKEKMETITTPKGRARLEALYSRKKPFLELIWDEIPDKYKIEIKKRLAEAGGFRKEEKGKENINQQVYSSMSAAFPSLSVYMRSFTTIACLSEDVTSILMWSHYADSHKGFALEYDFRPTLETPVPDSWLFPVIYSDKRFDASALMAEFVLNLMDIETILEDILAVLKVALFKSKLWEYEKEWRFFRMNSDQAPSTIEYRPTAIYYGLNMVSKNKERLHAIALAKGIKEYEMTIEYDSDDYKMQYKALGPGPLTGLESSH